ncbi:MAG: hypothetical protein LRS41_04330 [Caldisphaeraceae archaeon]|nr:hypothetical protein [Caldisphaeraceae archaeon]
MVSYIEVDSPENLDEAIDEMTDFSDDINTIIDEVENNKNEDVDEVLKDLKSEGLELNCDENEEELSCKYRFRGEVIEAEFTINIEVEGREIKGYEPGKVRITIK